MTQKCLFLLRYVWKRYFSQPPALFKTHNHTYLSYFIFTPSTGRTWQIIKISYFKKGEESLERVMTQCHRILKWGNKTSSALLICIHWKQTWLNILIVIQHLRPLMYIVIMTSKPFEPEGQTRSNTHLLGNVFISKNEEQSHRICRNYY